VDISSVYPLPIDMQSFKVSFCTLTSPPCISHGFLSCSVSPSRSCVPHTSSCASRLLTARLCFPSISASISPVKPGSAPGFSTLLLRNPPCLSALLSLPPHLSSPFSVLHILYSARVILSWTSRAKSRCAPVVLHTSCFDPSPNPSEWRVIIKVFGGITQRK